MTTRSFPPDTAAVRRTRRFVADALDGVSGEIVENAILMTSELASNSVRHAKSRFTVEVEVDVSGDAIRIEVTDDGGGRPSKRTPGSNEVTGRGLLIIDHLADDWGTTTRAGRTTVWFLLRRDQVRAAAR
jgi:serine/threonine-protein kinase RsbW